MQSVLAELLEATHPLGLKGTFLIFRGYIDESYNERIFTLSCLVSTGKEWTEFSRGWKLTLDAWNRKLKAQGRPQLTRYHAVYCSNRKREFEGWERDERNEFVCDLMRGFKRHPFDTVAFSIDLDEFRSVIPESLTASHPDFRSYIYGLAMKMLVYKLDERRCSAAPEKTRLALIHERSPYDAIVLEAFNQVLDEPGFDHKECFVSLTSMGWENCIPLQPADLVAYENFKDSIRHKNPKDRSPALDMLINLKTFGGQAQFMGGDAIQRWRRVLADMGRIPPTASTVSG